VGKKCQKTLGGILFDWHCTRAVLTEVLAGLVGLGLDLVFAFLPGLSASAKAKCFVCFCLLPSMRPRLCDISRICWCIFAKLLSSKCRDCDLSQVISIEIWSRRTCCVTELSVSRLVTLVWRERLAHSLRTPIMSPPAGTWYYCYYHYYWYKLVLNTTATITTTGTSWYLILLLLSLLLLQAGTWYYCYYHYYCYKLVLTTTATITTTANTRHRRSFEIRVKFKSAVRFDSIRKWLADSKNFWIESAVPAPMLVVSLVKQLKPLTALSGTVYRLASSMSDHSPVV